MKLVRKILSVTLAFFSAANIAMADSSTTGNATATITSGIAVERVRALSFGTFIAGNSNGTINQSGIFSGGVTLVGNPNDGREAGSFRVLGTPNTAYRFTLPSTATISNGTNNMTVNLSFASDDDIRSISNDGTEIVLINGTLNVLANQPLGTYQGTYNVSVEYN